MSVKRAVVSEPTRRGFTKMWLSPRAISNH
jgi:hypothetical protein